LLADFHTSSWENKVPQNTKERSIKANFIYSYLLLKLLK
jgi:hypothetical protein